LSTPLRNAARAHSADMLQRKFFEHAAPTEAWDTRVSRYLKSSLIGENIAWGTGYYGSPAGVVKQWMNSPTHRQIILTTGFHRVVSSALSRISRQGGGSQQPGCAEDTPDICASEAAPSG
jgi:uncharacterized protein YkwD